MFFEHVVDGARTDAIARFHECTGVAGGDLLFGESRSNGTGAWPFAAVLERAAEPLGDVVFFDAYAPKASTVHASAAWNALFVACSCGDCSAARSALLLRGGEAAANNAANSMRWLAKSRSAFYAQQWVKERLHQIEDVLAHIFHESVPERRKVLVCPCPCGLGFVVGVAKRPARHQSCMNCRCPVPGALHDQRHRTTIKASAAVANGEDINAFVRGDAKLCKILRSGNRWLINDKILLPMVRLN